jgi:DNA-binding YbaB/EbfC family protein
VVNRTNDRWFELTQKGFYVAEACNGRTDFSSLAFLPEHQAILHQMIQEGVAEECREGDSIEPWQAYRKADNPLLRVIHWCVTGRCNLKCRHCYMQAPAGRYGELPHETMLSLVEQFEQSNVVQVTLTGGEPFLRGDLPGIMAALARRGIWVNDIYTNGVLLTEETLGTIRATGLAPRFQISFDGLGGHEYMRGTAGIQKGVIEAIRKVRAAGFTVIVASCIDRVNVGFLGDTYNLLRDLDVQAWRIGAPLAMGNWRAATTDLSLAEQAQAYTLLLERWLNDGRPFELVLGQFLRAARNAGPAAGEPEASYTPESYDCGSCRENPNLLPDGVLLPCPGYVDSTLQDRMPNVLTEGLSKAWTESLLRSLADVRKGDLLARNEECRRCELFGRCGAGCRASALRETGILKQFERIELSMKVRIPQQGGNQQDMIKKVKKLQDDMQAKQEELDSREYEVASVGGMVTVKINGTKEITGIKIDPSVVSADDIEMLEDMLTAAVNEAIKKVESTNESEMQKLTGGLNLPNIPGF